MVANKRHVLMRAAMLVALTCAGVVEAQLYRWRGASGNLGVWPVSPAVAPSDTRLSRNGWKTSDPATTVPTTRTGSAITSTTTGAARPLLGVHRWNGSPGPPGIISFEAWLGKPVEIAVAFLGAPNATEGWAFVEGPSWNLGPWSAWRRAKPGRKLSLQVPMMPSGMDVTLAQIEAGQHDAHYARLANSLSAHRMLDIELRIGHEMDGGWYAWGAPAGSGKEANFVGAYRRIVNVMRQAQPTNEWVLVWNPTSEAWPLPAGAAYLESIYPGDSYVDQVGSDTYDKSFVNGKAYYPSGADRLARQQEVWASHLVRLHIMRDFAIRHGKPLQFPEWGLVTYKTGNIGWGGGDNPHFIQKMYEFFADPANGVVMQGYFDTSNGEGDFRVGPTNTIHRLASAKYKQLFGAGSQ
jgi:hypothetical protein